MLHASRRCRWTSSQITCSTAAGTSPLRTRLSAWSAISFAAVNDASTPAHGGVSHPIKTRLPISSHTHTVVGMYTSMHFIGPSTARIETVELPQGILYCLEVAKGNPLVLALAQRWKVADLDPRSSKSLAVGPRAPRLLVIGRGACRQPRPRATNTTGYGC